MYQKNFAFFRLKKRNVWLSRIFLTKRSEAEHSFPHFVQKVKTFPSTIKIVY